MERDQGGSKGTKASARLVRETSVLENHPGILALCILLEMAARESAMVPTRSHAPAF